MARFGTLAEHARELQTGLAGIDQRQIDALGHELAIVLGSGGRLLAAGNGGSAAEAQHLTGELVGRFEQERRALSAIALHADTSSVTAIGNDYGGDAIFARQVLAHGRPGDVLVVLSTSGRSPNLRRAAQAARQSGVRVWALTGPAPNPLEEAADEVIAVPSKAPTVVQEVHLVVIHALCASVDQHLSKEVSR
ncbi:SIS domain-containing protein [Kribbella sp. NBC_01505]|uniref:D-sedoheptulose-7-phosphate isomerase n=1 Tax=Kribbella sp. NBC_01505 TaxID=2903580 RepID=UPI003870AC6F